MSAIALHYSLVVVSCLHKIPKSLTVVAPGRDDELKIVNGSQNTMDMDLGLLGSDHFCLLAPQNYPHVGSSSSRNDHLTLGRTPMAEAGVGSSSGSWVTDMKV